MWGLIVTYLYLSRKKLQRVAVSELSCFFFFFNLLGSCLLLTGGLDVRKYSARIGGVLYREIPLAD